MKRSKRITTVCTSAVILLFSTYVSVFAQLQTGTLRGNVTDPGGLAVAGATVAVKSQSNGVVTSTVTNGEGIYSVPGLAPGKYTVTVEAVSGFSRKVVNDISVPIGQITDVPIVLAVGAASETVTVTSANAEIINRDQSQISSTFETRQIQELPSNGAGGGIDTLALLAPGVVANQVGGTNTNGTGLSVNGNRGRSNNFQIDGSDNNDLTIGGPSIFVDNTSQIAEFQIISNNFSAQYGRNQGAVINIVTKQGGNAFHGDLFEYHQDQRNLDSLNNIERRGGQQFPDRNLYNLFGGTVGGPIWLPSFGSGDHGIWKGKDRAFFFFSYQGVRNPSTTTTSSTNLGVLPGDYSRLLATFPGNAPINDLVTLGAFASPLGNSRVRTDVGAGFASALNLSAPSGCAKAIAVGTTPSAGCGTYTAFVNPATGQPFLTGGPYDVINFGTANAPSLFQGAQYARDFPTAFTENEWSLRFTVKASSKDSIDFRYLNQRQVFQNAVATANGNGFSADVPALGKNLGGTWTRQISNNMVNELKITTQQLDVLFGGGDPSLGNFLIPSPDKIQDTVANLVYGALGVTKTVALNPIGGGTGSPQGRLVKVYQFADNLTYTRGRQSFIFGAEFKYLTNLSPFLPFYQGQFSFSNGANSLARTLNNAPATVTVSAGNPLTKYTEKDQYYFVQDDLKLRSNLTLNLGVRYEYTGQPLNELHDQTLARESNPATAFWDPTLPINVRTTPQLKADKNNWAPRVGFAYSPKFESGLGRKLFGEDATVLRGGFSIAYDPAFYNILLNLQNVAPYSVSIALNTTNGLPSSPTAPSPFSLPGGIPTATVVQAKAAASGLLPLGHLNPLFLTQTTVARDFHDPYSEQWSFGLQRQINRNNVFEVRYVGTHGVGLFQNINGNFFVAPMANGFSLSGINFPAFPNLLPTGTKAQVCVDNTATPFVNEGACNGRVLPQGSLTVRANTAQSIFHSMQSQYTGRFLKNSLSIGASYTYSKTIDNASEIFAFGDVNTANAVNPFCIGKCERALSDLDHPHAFSASFIYDLPFKKEQHGFVGHLAGGWQLNGVYVLTSGTPFTPGEAINGSYGLGNTYLTSGDRPYLANSKVDPKLVGVSQIDAFFIYSGNVPCAGTITNPNGFYSMSGINNGQCVNVTTNDVHFIVGGPGAAKIFGTPFGTSARNSLRGPALNQLNMSMFKNTRIGERVNLQFRAEAFNVLNHPSPGFGTFGTGGFAPNINVDNAGVSGAGFDDFKDITMNRRVIQFGLRIVF